MIVSIHVSTKYIVSLSKSSLFLTGFEEKKPLCKRVEETEENCK